ncbi:hypothetical protein [Pedobacter ghigonis]|uniref:hypothetical protein n=1 Tax=Pedobacter ghigonis TaxID=2730403 RepID=UPI001588929C|nr:hypothetical protein [Pedobacter ghigonis]
MKNTFHHNRHIVPSTMVIEALDEYIYAIGEMLKYRKQDSSIWANPNFGTLGYPVTVLLFVIVDTIASYHSESSKPLQIKVDGNSVKITRPSTHFNILNSEYFNLDLKSKEINALYRIGRSRLIHNSVIGDELTLVAGRGVKFIEVNEYPGKGKYVIYLTDFYEACIAAVNMFKTNKEEIFKHSKKKTLPKSQGNDGY